MRVMDKATNRPINQWIYGGMNRYANKNLNKRRDTPDVTTSTLIIVPLFRISIDVFSPSKIAIFFFRKKLGTDRRRDGPTEGGTDGGTDRRRDEPMDGQDLSSRCEVASMAKNESRFNLLRPPGGGKQF